MKKVITYGTFDLLHYGHINILKRAKALGDYLIVGVTSDAYDRERGKLNVKESLIQRVENVRSTGLADEIIVEEFDGQKILDIQKYDIDLFVIGSDWIGKFDYLKEYCKVIYLERTRGVSSTELRMRDHPIIKLGIVGSGRIAKRFVSESKFVSGINVEGVFNPKIDSARRFMEEEELEFATDDLRNFFSKVEAVYIASPHSTHFGYIQESLRNGKHVLCEKPMVLKEEEARIAYSAAARNGLVLMEAIKTAYCPAFEHLQIMAKCGKIGEIKDIDASFTKLVSGDVRELDAKSNGGSVNELVTYVVLPSLKLLGTSYQNIEFYSCIKNDIDVFTKGILVYPNATASFKVGLGAKTEGSLIITGTKGYIYVPAPWWKTEYFELRYEDTNNTDKYFYKFLGDGLRYEMQEFLNLIYSNEKTSLKFTPSESIAIAKLIESYNAKINCFFYK